MFTYNAVGPISASLKALNQRLREESLAYKALDEGADEDVVEGVQKDLDKADVLLDELGVGEERVAVDTRLSTVGQQQEMVKIVADVRTRLAFVEKAATDRRDAAAQARKALEAIPKPSGDPVVARLEEMEIRERLRSLEMAQRMQVYLTATAAGDASIVRAVKTAPAGEVLIEPEFLKRIDHEALERSKPEQLRRVRTLEYAADKLTLLASAIEATLGGYGHTVNFPTPPVRTANLGRNNSQAAPAKSAADAPPVGGLKFQ
jgi:hypothetical protein